jgi:hypothetical protein
MNYVSPNPVASGIANLVTGYTLQDDCPNWDEALAIARVKMSCGVGGKPVSAKCQKHLPCDVCQFLENGTWPPVSIVDFPGEEAFGQNPHIRGYARGDPRYVESCPVDDESYTEFKSSLCFGKVVMGFDRVDTLAKAMVHEGLHMCQYVGGRGSATKDKDFATYLYEVIICGTYAPDAADTVEICWKAED